VNQSMEETLEKLRRDDELDDFDDHDNTNFHFPLYGQIITNLSQVFAQFFFSTQIT